MASKKREVNFNEYWDALKHEAQSRGWGVGHFMEVCRIPRQRYSEFETGRTLSGMYFEKLMGGLGLTQDQIEKKAGRRMSDAQIRERKVTAWIAANPDIIDKMIDNPNIAKIIREMQD